jgi:hypothetical protein
MVFFVTEQAASDAGERAEECASEPLRAQPGRRVQNERIFLFFLL